MSTKTDKTYQGHKDRAHWSVALFIDNDYPAYKLAQRALDEASYSFANMPAVIAHNAASMIVSRLADLACTFTPERFKITHERVLAWVHDELKERAIQAGSK